MTRIIFLVLTNCLLLYQEVLFDMSSNNKALCSTHWLVPWGTHIRTYLFLRCLSLFFSLLLSLFSC